MNKKIDSYINGLFDGVPNSKKAMDLKEEILSNMTERYNDYIAEGCSESIAYSKAVSSIGDVDSLIAEVMPDENFFQNEKKYRLRSARNISISVFLYIIGLASLIAFEEFGKSQTRDAVGVLSLLVFSAFATVILIYTKISTPPEFASDKSNGVSRKKHYSQDKLKESIISIYWSVITLIYFVWSFVTFKWYITWIIWPLAGVASKIIDVLFELREAE